MPSRCGQREAEEAVVPAADQRGRAEGGDDADEQDAEDVEEADERAGGDDDDVDHPLARVRNDSAERAAAITRTA